MREGEDAFAPLATQGTIGWRGELEQFLGFGGLEFFEVEGDAVG